MQLPVIRNWAFWSIPASARGFLLGTEVLAAVLTIGLLVDEPPTQSVMLRFALLLALGTGYAELGGRYERIRRYLGDGKLGSRPNPLSVWSFAALLTLSIGWAAAFVVAQHVHMAIQRRRERTGQPHRQAFNAAVAVLAQLAAAAVIDHSSAGDVLDGRLTSSVSVLVAAVVFTLVSLGVLLAGIWLAGRPPSIRAILPDRDALGYELSCLVFGIAVAVLLLHTPWLVAVMLGPVAYLHRSSMFKMVQQASRTDSKTGLLNAVAWTEHARSVLSRLGASRHAAVLVIDADHFKAINDRHGHLAGDQVLLDIAGCLRAQLRGQDGLGRFGGDEFVVLLDGVDPGEAASVADRLGTALAAIRVEDDELSVSIGLAHTEAHGTEVQQLLAAADAALYAAKDAGRGTLRVAPVPEGLTAR